MALSNHQLAAIFSDIADRLEIQGEVVFKIRAYRTAAQDQRLWGTPFNMMLQPSDFSASGEVVAKRAQVAFGELMKTDVEAFIKEQLKIP